MAYDGKYHSPEDLAADSSVSHDEKLKMLQQWCNDEEDLLRASEEGMQSEDHSNTLKQVKKVLLALQETS